MTTTSRRCGFRKPEMTDGPPNIVVATNGIDDIDYVSVPIYADTAARLAANPAPAVGQHVYLAGTGHGGDALQLWNGSAWTHYWEGTRIAQKTANTARNTSTVVTDDPHLTLTVGATATYIVKGVFFIKGDATLGDFKFGFSHPANTQAHWGIACPAVALGGGATEGDMTWLTQNVTSATTSGPAFSGVSNTTDYLTAKMFGWFKTGGNAGSLTVQWAVASGSFTDTTLRQGSYIRARRIG